jgi:hypothetical protein
MALPDDYSERPSKCTPELIETICARLISGASIRTICADKAMPSITRFYQWLDSDVNLQKQYARACEARAHYKFEQIEEVVKDMRSGMVDAAMARVEIDAVKWQASKLNPKKYGDTTQIKHADAEGGKLGIAGILGAIDGRSTSLPKDDE